MTVDDFVDQHRDRFSVQVLCRAARYSTSTYYARRRRQGSGRTDQDAALVAQIAKERRGKRRVYGRRRVRAGLRRRGLQVNHKRIARVMRSQGWYGIPVRRKPRSAEPVLAIHRNLVQRRFHAGSPNRLWMGDVKEIATGEGPIHLAAYEDAFSRYVVGHAFSITNDTQLAAEALRKAVTSRRPQRGLIHHTDQGSPYLSWSHQGELERIGALPSCSAPGTPLDNACIESFFSTLQRELLDDVTFSSRRQAIAEVTNWIRFYNRDRFHSTLGYLSPAEYERAQ